MKQTLRLLAGVAALGVALFPFPGHDASAQEKYPSRPIRLIVPFPAGGPVDVMGRLIGHRLSSSLGQQVIIDNRPGAGSTLAGRAAATSDPDGYTLLVGSAATMAIGPALYPNAGYDPLKDFVPDRVHRNRALRDGRRTEGCCQQRQGIDRARQGQSRQAQFRRAERCAAAHDRGLVPRRDQDRHRDRALSRRVGRSHRHDGQSDPARIRDHLGHVRSCPRRQDQGARRRDAQAPAGVAGGCHHDRKRAARLRGRLMDRADGARRHAEGDRPAAELRTQCRAGVG